MRHAAAAVQRLSRTATAALVAALVLAVAFIDVAAGPDTTLRPIYYIPIAAAVYFVGRAFAYIVAAGCLVAWFASDYAVGASTVMGWAAVWNTIITVVTFHLLILLLHHLFSLRREMEARIAARTLSLAAAQQNEMQLQHELLEVAANERTNIGYQLHDGLCQHLTATAMAARLLIDDVNRGSPKARGRADEVLKLIEDSIAQCRSLAAGLAPEDEITSLSAHLQSLKRRIEQSSKIAVHCPSFPPLQLGSSEAKTLAHILDEAVRNAVKHAEPANIWIAIESQPGQTCFEIANDGRSFAAAPGATGMGLRIMRRRAQAIGAALEFSPRSAGGTQVRVRLRTT